MNLPFALADIDHVALVQGGGYGYIWTIPAEPAHHVRQLGLDIPWHSCLSQPCPIIVTASFPLSEVFLDQRHCVGMGDDLSSRDLDNVTGQTIVVHVTVGDDDARNVC